jgi:hypothetical protein
VRCTLPPFGFSELRPDLGYTPPVRGPLLAVIPRLALWGMASACAPAPLGGVEPWRSAPEVRLAVLSSDEGVQVWALDARAPVRAELEAPEGAELWLLGYRDDTLRAAFPGLAGVDGAALPARLAPRLGGDGGEPTPMADDVLQAVVEPELGLRYTARSWTDWRARAARGLELRLVVDDAAVCGVAQTRELDAPPALEVDDVVALDAGQALAFGRRRDAADAQVQVWRVDADDTWHDLGARPQRGPLLGRPRWDRVTRAAWGVSADGELFLVSPTGLVLPPPPPPALPDVTPRARRLAIGRDGAVFATFPRAYVDNDFGPRVDPALLAYEDGAWRFAPDRPPRVGGVVDVEVARAGRIALRQACWLQDLDENTGGWVERVYDFSCNMGLTPTMRAIALDDELAMVVGADAYAQQRVEGTGAWRDVSPGLPRADYVHAVALGGERALVADTAGALYVRRGGRWCPRLTATPTPVVAMSAAPEGGRAVLVLEGGARLRSVELP